MTSCFIRCLTLDPVPSGNGINSQGATASSSATTITIVINDNLFSDVNGAVIALQVFVSEEHGVYFSLSVSVYIDRFRLSVSFLRFTLMSASRKALVWLFSTLISDFSLSSLFNTSVWYMSKNEVEFNHTLIGLRELSQCRREGGGDTTVSVNKISANEDLRLSEDYIIMFLLSSLFTASNTDRTISDPPLRYQQVRDLLFRTAYVTSPLFAPTPFRGRRKRQIADTLTTYTIGSERECVSEDSICNGPLEPLTSYRYSHNGFIRSWFSILKPMIDSLMIDFIPWKHVCHKALVTQDSVYSVKRCIKQMQQNVCKWMASCNILRLDFWCHNSPIALLIDLTKIWRWKFTMFITFDFAM